MNGRRPADAQSPATAAGYRALPAWMRGFGRLHAVGVEGTGSYGAALLITAPAQLREELAGSKGANLIQACSDLRPTGT
jgi:hypothetical protein